MGRGTRPFLLRLLLQSARKENGPRPGNGRASERKIDKIDTEGMIVSSTTTRSDREQLLASWYLPLGEGEGKGDADADSGTDRLF